jgi:hypothetical protein
MSAVDFSAAVGAGVLAPGAGMTPTRRAPGRRHLLAGAAALSFLTPVISALVRLRRPAIRARIQEMWEP